MPLLQWIADYSHTNTSLENVDSGLLPHKLIYAQRITHHNIMHSFMHSESHTIEALQADSGLLTHKLPHSMTPQRSTHKWPRQQHTGLARKMYSPLIWTLDRGDVGYMVNFGRNRLGGKCHFFKQLKELISIKYLRYIQYIHD